MADVWEFFKYSFERGQPMFVVFLNTPLGEGQLMFVDFLMAH